MRTILIILQPIGACNAAVELPVARPEVGISVVIGPADVK